MLRHRAIIVRVDDRTVFLGLFDTVEKAIISHTKFKSKGSKTRVRKEISMTHADCGEKTELARLRAKISAVKQIFSRFYLYLKNNRKSVVVRQAYTAGMKYR